MRVLKWSVPVDDQPHPIGSGRVLHVACQSGADTVQVWTLEGNAALEALMGSTRDVQVFGTGQELPEGAGAGYHIGTGLAADGALVWHVFQVPAST